MLVLLDEMFSKLFARRECFFAFASEPLATMHLALVGEPFMATFVKVATL